MSDPTTGTRDDLAVETELQVTPAPQETDVTVTSALVAADVAGLAEEPELELRETPEPVAEPVAEPGPALAEGEAAVDDVPAPDEPPGIDLDALPSGPRGAVEAILMVVEAPIDTRTLASALDLTVPAVTDLLTELAADYDETGRGFELREVAGGWRIYSRGDYAPVVERFMRDGQTARLTQAALETLAIVAYRQPVSRARVSAIRGVNVDAVMRTLFSRGLVEEAGTAPETGAVLYRTTTYFLQRLGLQNLDDLPALAPYLPEVDALDDAGFGGAT